METNNFFNTIILTTTVFAAFITSIANVIISLINNYRLKKWKNENRSMKLISTDIADCMNW